ncbi:tripartite tricarboxylate transporter substrate binding protein [Variovorax sp. KK3]|uniref:Bug family tripartite tricarboxylate transporter substrate binding protein n=1 Tax=Variovorax sp. KK3 TaxID=1855728 RepID=UPI00097C8A6E|nr:tripartite tricarboxylate transporter substrate binding protein [Variovorax sp. KK3]
MTKFSEPHFSSPCDAGRPAQTTRRLALASLLTAATALAGLGVVTPAQADDKFPSKPVRILVGSQAGGGVDAFSRLIATRLQEMWGQPVVVENRTGASGSIAADMVAKAPADGYTVVMATPNSHTTGPHVLKFPYDPLRDFSPITLVMEVPSVLVVDKSSPAKTMKELVDIAKAQPGKLNYYSSGNGSIQHLAGEMLNLQAGIKVVHVPYKGSAPAIADVIGQNVTMGIDPISATLSFIEAGTLKPLAVAAPKRASSLPEVPTTAEAGFPGIEMSTWYGLFGPANMPEALARKWQQDVAKVIAQPDMAKRIAAVGGEPRGSSAAQFGDFIKAEYDKMGKLARTANVRAE